jgi:hypothetical protein
VLFQQSKRLRLTIQIYGRKGGKGRSIHHKCGETVIDGDEVTKFAYVVVMVDILKSKVKDRIWIQRRKTFIGSIPGGSKVHF